jgi:quercetin dioxygenase-like cupin family protein
VRNLWKGGLAILGAIAINTVGMTQAHAQNYWSPRIVASPYEMNGFLNKDWTKLADVKAGKDPLVSWRQKVVEGQNLRAYYVGLKVGDSTKKRMSSDHRIGFIVWEGSVEVTVQGQPTLMAKKGTMIQVPARLEYQLKNVGTTPSLHFEVFPKEMEDFPTLIYSENSATLPALPQGQQWTLSEIGAPDTFTRLPAQNANFNFFRHYLDSPSSSEFVRDDRFFMNAIREGGQANAATNPDIGHFHVYGEEFWFIIEGTVGFLKEGAPYQVASAGDIVYNPPMRWHRMGTAGTAQGTRIAINGYRFGAHHLPRPNNTASDNQFAFTVVNTPPTTTPMLPPATANGSYLQPTVKLPAYPDANSTEDGMDYTEYWLDGAPTPTRYTGPFQVSGNGQHTLVYRSVDKAGNVEDPKTLTVGVIDLPPLTLQAVPSVLNLRIGGYVTTTITAPAGYDLRAWGVADIRAEGSPAVTASYTSDGRAIVATFNKAAFASVPAGSGVKITVTGQYNYDGAQAALVASTLVTVVR